MQILRLLQGGPFGPEQIQIMHTAYEEALQLAGITDRTTSIADALARRVIILFKRGESDPEVIAEKALGAENLGRNE